MKFITFTNRFSKLPVWVKLPVWIFNYIAVFTIIVLIAKGLFWYAKMIWGWV